jgi:hypothetical protein
MKIIKIILLVFFGLWVTYVIYLYVSSPRVTYLIPKGYEGPLLIVANQRNGIEIDRNHAVYDFTQDNVVKLKGDLLTGFFPWGYLNYYAMDEAGNKEKLETINEVPNKADTEANRIYLWSRYHKVGSCEIGGGNRTSYEFVIVSKESNTDKYLKDARDLINREACSNKDR